MTVLFSNTSLFAKNENGYLLRHKKVKYAIFFVIVLQLVLSASRPAHCSYLDLKTVGKTELHKAVLSEDVETVKRLLKENPQLAKLKDQNGFTLLHYSAYKGNTEITEILLNTGADIKVLDMHSTSPIHFAALSGNPELVRLLIKRGANPSSIDKADNSPLHYAAFSKNRETLILLLKYNKNVNLQDTTRDAPLHNAAMAGWTEGAALLIEAGADVNLPGNSKWTALHQAAYRDYPQLVKLLLSKGANPYMEGIKESAPLDLCWGENECMKILLQRGCKISQKEISNIIFRKDWSYLKFILLNSRDIHLKIFLPIILLLGLILFLIFRTRKKNT